MFQGLTYNKLLGELGIKPRPSGSCALTAIVQAPEAPRTLQGFSQVASRRSLTNKIYIHTQYYSPKYAHFVTYEKKQS